MRVPTCAIESGRFWAKVQKTETCWLWTAAATAKGYGCIYHDGRQQLAHRVLYEYTHGPIAAGMQLDHLCRVPACVKPDHLEPVTSRENTMRGVNFSAYNAVKTHCPRGHEYNAENTYIWPRDGSRKCRECTRQYLRELRARRVFDPRIKRYVERVAS